MSGVVVEVPLTRGQVALVDFEDAAWALQFKWCAAKNHSGLYYAKREAPSVGGRRHTIFLHREIALRAGLAIDGLQVDHVNGNGLDNRRENLRPATCAENNHNARKRIDNTSGFKGVSWHKRKKRWHAQIKLNSRVIYLGMFDTPEAAHDAYCAAAAQYHGQFMRCE